MAAPEISAKLDALPPTTESAECLSDEEVLAFASGTLKSSRLFEAHFHFDQCEVCQRLLSEAAHALATAETTPFQESDELSWHTTFQPGTLVGHRYLIRHFIARGGMGEVYEAFDRDLQERVALKTVTSTACDNASAVRRLKAEVQLARRVSHPNVCRIYDFGTHVMPDTGAQISFLTMEFVDGETLGQRVRLTGALPIEEARLLGRQLLRGLSAAHDAGVLHRDFKSDNVMLRDEAGDTSSPLILDFGLARALDQGSLNSSSSNSNLLGTFGYIAPEQLQGKPHSTASDVYSFGVVWFEMLTGELPFESASSPVETALARLQGPAVAPSSKNPLVPADLDAIVQGCLRRSPKDRFRTASEVLTALDAFETRARGSFQKRRLVPLTIAAVLGAIAAYVAAIPSNRKPIAEAGIHANLPAQTPPRGSEVEPAASPPPQPPVADSAPPTAQAPPATAASAAKQARLPRGAAPQKTADARSPKAVSEADTPERTPQQQVGTGPPPRIPDWEDPFDAGTPRATRPVAGGGSAAPPHSQ
ncbi:MAG: serine/threonine-protein kinase [Pseudomonadota bacterium]